MKLSYAVTVKDELVEIQKLLNQIFLLKKSEDEVIVVFDEKNGSEEVKEFLDSLDNPNFKLHGFEFNDDFSELKNFLISKCSGDYVFNLDADEFLTQEQHNNIIKILEQNQHIDAFLLPRINILTGLTRQQAENLKTRLNEKGWLDYPDYQTRIFKNLSSIRWKNKIHEVLIGVTNAVKLNPLEELSILHIKTAEKQNNQHRYYTEKFYIKEQKC